jgi:hypothetical protein
VDHGAERAVHRVIDPPRLERAVGLLLEQERELLVEAAAPFARAR